MSNICVIHSESRNRGTYPYPSQFVIDPIKISGNHIFGRTTQQIQKNPRFRSDEFVSSIKIVNVIVPYVVNVTDNLPMIYMSLRSLNDSNTLIFTTNPKTKYYNFVLFMDRILTDDNGVKRWIYYKAGYTQVMQFHRTYPIEIKISDKLGSILSLTGDEDELNDPVSSLQTTVIFEIEPFINDADYTNHSTQPIAF